MFARVTFGYPAPRYSFHARLPAQATTRLKESMMRFPTMQASCATAFLIAGTANADVVTDWNIKTLELSQAAQATSNAQARSLAMVHVAMSDAINSVTGKFSRYSAS